MKPLELVLDHYAVRYSETCQGEQTILCPVHEERRPSASLNLEKEVWQCHACGKAGTAAQIVMEREGVGPEAATKLIQEIARDNNVKLSTESKPGRRVPKGKGYKPGYRRKVQTRRGSRSSFGS